MLRRGESETRRIGGEQPPFAAAQEATTPAFQTIERGQILAYERSRTRSLRVLTPRRGLDAALFRLDVSQIADKLAVNWRDEASGDSRSL